METFVAAIGWASPSLRTQTTTVYTPSPSVNGIWNENVPFSATLKSPRLPSAYSCRTISSVPSLRRVTFWGRRGR